MSDFEDLLKQTLREDKALSEDKLAAIRKETQVMYEKELRNNRTWTAVIVVLGLCVATLWGWLFWQSDQTKFQILWAGLLVGEFLGISICGVFHFVYEFNLTARKERRELELQIAELKEKLETLAVR